MCSATSDYSSALRLCSFSCNLIYSKRKYELNKIHSWLVQIKSSIRECYLKVISVQGCILRGLLPEIVKVNYINETLFVNSNCLCKTHNKWSVFEFKYHCKTFKRILKVIPSPKVPVGCILCSNDTHFMIKHSFSISPFTVNNSVHMKLLQVLPDYCHQPAIKLVTKVLYCPPHVPSVLFDRTLERFIKTPKLMHTGDVITIDLMTYGVDKTADYIHFKVAKIEGRENLYCPSFTIEHSFVVSQATNVYGESSEAGYLPSLEWFFVEPNKLSTITPLLPFGLEKYYFCMLKKILPFLVSSMNGLKPMFIMSGTPGSGKSIILKAISKKLGLHYWNIDCNNIVSNTLTQINVNIKTTLSNAAARSPCILHLNNFDILSSESDGLDAVQLCENLRINFNQFTPPFPVIIVATCTDIESLSRELVRLSLDQMHVALPTEHERKLMVSWLARVHGLKIIQKDEEFLISESKSFNFMRIRNVLCLANKERLISSDDFISISHLTTVLAELSSTERLLSTVEWADVGGVELIKKEVVSSLVSSRLLSRNGHGASGAKRTGLLLHGPPGTGKTLLARAVASQSMRAFVPVNGPDLLNMYVGQSEANVRAVFNRARESSPCIMFFDELDSIAPNRGNKSDSGGVMDRVVSTLLSEMDSLDTNGDVFILGATNRPDLLDPALIRPGRFDKMLYIGPCQDDDSKLKVLKALSRKFVMNGVKLEELIERLPEEVTGAQLYAICSTAWNLAARELIRNEQVNAGSQVIVNMKHFEQAIKEAK